MHCSYELKVLNKKGGEGESGGGGVRKTGEEEG